MNTTEYTLNLPQNDAYQVLADHDYDVVADLQTIFRRVGELRMKGYAVTAKRINGKLSVAAGAL
jgi:hypothetical protein